MKNSFEKYGENMDTNVLAKQIVNEVESSYLSLASAYDLNATEQLDFLTLIESSIDVKLETLKQEIETAYNLVYCQSCDEYYKVEDCKKQIQQDKYERRSSLTDKGQEVRSEIVRKYEEVLICPEDHLIDWQWKKECVDKEKQKSLEEQWSKQMREELSRAAINEESKDED